MLKSKGLELFPVGPQSSDNVSITCIQTILFYFINSFTIGKIPNSYIHY